MHPAGLDASNPCRYDGNSRSPSNIVGHTSILSFARERKLMKHFVDNFFSFVPAGVRRKRELKNSMKKPIGRFR
jgi:hypothetical protein